MSERSLGAGSSEPNADAEKKVRKSPEVKVLATMAALGMLQGGPKAQAEPLPASKLSEAETTQHAVASAESQGSEQETSEKQLRWGETTLGKEFSAQLKGLPQDEQFRLRNRWDTITRQVTGYVLRHRFKSADGSVAPEQLVNEYFDRLLRSPRFARAQALVEKFCQPSRGGPGQEFVIMFLALIAEESDFNARQVSTAGAKGLMQVVPSSVLRGPAGNFFDPARNILVGVKEWNRYYDEFDDAGLASFIYNEGLGHFKAQAGALKQQAGYRPNTLVAWYDALRQSGNMVPKAHRRVGRKSIRYPFMVAWFEHELRERLRTRLAFQPSMPSRPRRELIGTSRAEVKPSQVKDRNPAIITHRRGRRGS